MYSDKKGTGVYSLGAPAGKLGLNRKTFDENCICKMVKKREKGKREKKD
jgi:hypothetical protein